jgi:hypothetical protein
MKSRLSSNDSAVVARLDRRPSIPETALLNLDASGILDAPLEAGHDIEWVA